MKKKTTKANLSSDVKITIELFNKWQGPYWLSYKQQKKESCISSESSKYEVNSYELFCAVLKEFLDSPEKSLDEKAVRRDFEDHRMGPLSAESVQQILTYYNGRLKMFTKICKDVKKGLKSPLLVLKYDIPYSLNHFDVYSDGDEDKRKQLEAWLKIEISRS